MGDLTAADRLAGATSWTVREFESLDRELDAMGCVTTQLRRGGISYRLGGKVVLRMFPRSDYLALGFPQRMRRDVEALTGALRAQRGEGWLNYGPDVCERDAVTTLLALSAAVGFPAPRAVSPGAGGSVEGRSAGSGSQSTPESDRDHDDLRLILDLIDAFRRYAAARNQTPPIKALREAIWFHWEAPRLPAGGKYSPLLPHSPAARQRKANGERVGFVSEHVLPVKVLIAELLEDPPHSEEALRQRLLGHLDHVVITREEDKILTAAGVASMVPDRADPWSRYRSAGLDPTDFAPARLGQDL